MHRLPDGEVALKLNVLVRSRGVPERGDQDDPYAGTAPKPNTYAERWIRTLRVDCLDGRQFRNKKRELIGDVYTY
jgi:hypothetical protein